MEPVFLFFGARVGRCPVPYKFKEQKVHEPSENIV